MVVLLPNFHLTMNFQMSGQKCICSWNNLCRNRVHFLWTTNNSKIFILILEIKFTIMRNWPTFIAATFALVPSLSHASLYSPRPAIFQAEKNGAHMNIIWCEYKKNFLAPSEAQRVTLSFRLSIALQSKVVLSLQSSSFCWLYSSSFSRSNLYFIGWTEPKRHRLVFLLAGHSISQPAQPVFIN